MKLFIGAESTLGIITQDIPVSSTLIIRILKFLQVTVHFFAYFSDHHGNRPVSELAIAKGGGYNE